MEKPATLDLTHDPALRSRTLVLVGMMGAGKSSVGKRLAAALDLPFRDADEEIERAAGCTISEIFASRGEAEFREGERRVIARLLDEPPHVLATGGGAFMNPDTRALVAKKGFSIWLKVDPETLARRVGRKDNRPLLRGKDARQVLAEILETRAASYGEADLIVEADDGPHQYTVMIIIVALKALQDLRPPAGGRWQITSSQDTAVLTERNHMTVPLTIAIRQSKDAQ